MKPVTSEARMRQLMAAKVRKIGRRELKEILHEESRRGLQPRIETAACVLGSVDPKSLAAAKVKPAGCSDVRWRIELRRRRTQRRLCGVNVVGHMVFPDPDALD